jgi:CheY-like chemotaxis protein
MFILLADDDPEDLELFQELMSSIEPNLVIKAVSSGKALVEFLSTCSEGRFPDLIILDYNMPQMKGAELLWELSSDKRYGGIPKYVLSTSDSAAHIKECMDKGASAYFVKPGNLSEMETMIRNILASLN